MKKFLVTVLLAVLCVTGCGNSNKNLACEMSSDSSMYSLKQSVVYEISNSSFDKALMELSYVYKDNYVSLLTDSVLAELEDSLKNKFNRYGEVEFSRINNGIKVVVTLDRKGISTMTGAKDIEDLKTAMKNAGYICK